MNLTNVKRKYLETDVDRVWITRSNILRRTAKKGEHSQRCCGRCRGTKKTLSPVCLLGTIATTRSYFYSVWSP